MCLINVCVCFVLVIGFKVLVCEQAWQMMGK